jgi:hypothetical protein
MSTSSCRISLRRLSLIALLLMLPPFSQFRLQFARSVIRLKDAIYAVLMSSGSRGE